MTGSLQSCQLGWVVGTGAHGGTLRWHTAPCSVPQRCCLGPPRWGAALAWVVGARSGPGGCGCAQGYPLSRAAPTPPWLGPGRPPGLGLSPLGCWRWWWEQADLTPCLWQAARLGLSPRLAGLCWPGGPHGPQPPGMAERGEGQSGDPARRCPSHATGGSQSPVLLPAPAAPAMSPAVSLRGSAASAAPRQRGTSPSSPVQGYPWLAQCSGESLGCRHPAARWHLRPPQPTAPGTRGPVSSPVSVQALSPWGSVLAGCWGTPTASRQCRARSRRMVNARGSPEESWHLLPSHFLQGQSRGEIRR